MPDSLTVGSGSPTSCLASTTREGHPLYNVTVTFEADSIKTTDAYVGNIRSRVKRATWTPC
ncbi:MAG: hypothetical protein ACLR0U_01330 [Enterocloster clostridioformis]